MPDPQHRGPNAVAFQQVFGDGMNASRRESGLAPALQELTVRKETKM